MTKFQSARKAAYAAYRSNTAKKAGTVAGTCVLVAGAIAAGYLIGTAVLWVLIAVFGAKVGVIVYLILYGASCMWVFMFMFKKDADGFRA